MVRGRLNRTSQGFPEKGMKKNVVCRKTLIFEIQMVSGDYRGAGLLLWRI